MTKKSKNVLLRLQITVFGKILSKDAKRPVLILLTIAAIFFCFGVYCLITKEPLDVLIIPGVVIFGCVAFAWAIGKTTE